MIVTGFGPKTKKKQLQKPGDQYAEWLQEQVANLYDKEKVAGGRLGANTPAYNKWKAKNGFETKRGHLTNNTQIVLDTDDLMDVSIRGRMGQWRVIIRMVRQRFYDKVGGKVEGRSYVEFYEENKVPNERITAFKSGWTRDGRRFFKHLEAA